MNRLVLVNPPNQKHDFYDLAPPLGLLSLASIALEMKWLVEVIDLALLTGDEDDPDSFYVRATQQILSVDPAVVCFTSMGVNTHVCIEIARRIRTKQERLVTIAGGAHFSELSEIVRHQWPWIDLVIAGEGEASFRMALEETAKSGKVPAIALNGVTTPAVAIKHPHPAYELVDLQEYFRRNPRRVICYEGGRGCIYKCAFCYSPSHYSGVRELSAAEIVHDLSCLARLGASHVFMVQDNFVNSREHAVGVCDALEAAALSLTWNCYVTLPQVDIRLIEAMGRAGCRQVYLGVDAVSPNQIRLFQKRFVRDSGRLIGTLNAWLDHGIHPTCAFMVDLFNYDAQEIEQTLRLSARCAMTGASIRINVFTRYLGSLLGNGAHKSRYSEAKIRTMLDCPAVVIENKAAQSMPTAFPFHATEVDDEGAWMRRLRVIWLAQRLVQAYPDDFVRIGSISGRGMIEGVERMVDSSELGDIIKAVELGSCNPPAGEVF